MSSFGDDCLNYLRSLPEGSTTEHIIEPPKIKICNLEVLSVKKQLGESQKQLGENQKQLGESQKQLGESQKQCRVLEKRCRALENQLCAFKEDKPVDQVSKDSEQPIKKQKLP